MLSNRLMSSAANITIRNSVGDMKIEMQTTMIGMEKDVPGQSHRGKKTQQICDQLLC